LPKGFPLLNKSYKMEEIASNGNKQTAMEKQCSLTLNKFGRQHFCRKYINKMPMNKMVVITTQI